VSECMCVCVYVFMCVCVCVCVLRTEWRWVVLFYSLWVGVGGMESGTSDVVCCVC